LDAQLTDILLGNLATDAQAGAALTRLADRNLSQALGVIQNLCIQAQSGVTDDPAIMAALATAARVPVGGALHTSIPNA